MLGLMVECYDGFINCTFSNAYGVFLVAPTGMRKSSILPPKCEEKLVVLVAEAVQKN
jgi:hypothetical protein